METSKLNKLASSISKKYLNDELLIELKGYAKFFTKKGMIQPETSGTFEDLMRLCSLAIDLQAVRERVVLIFLDIKSAKSRLKRLQKELFSGNKIASEYKKQSNKEQRELFAYKKGKSIEIALDKARLFSEQCELILASIDSHVWVLKNNSQVLSRAARTND